MVAVVTVRAKHGPRQPRPLLKQGVRQQGPALATKSLAMCHVRFQRDCLGDHRENDVATDDELYSELKSEVALVAETLFDMSESLIRKRGSFLPHGAALTEQDELRLVAAGPDLPGDVTNSTEILPMLHDGLRKMCKDVPLKAVAVAEDVTITLEGHRPTKAIKVLFEHRRGLCVSIYLPFKKKQFGGYSFGPSFSKVATPEVAAWQKNGV